MIVKALAHSMGARVAVESGVGDGTAAGVQLLRTRSGPICRLPSEAGSLRRRPNLGPVRMKLAVVLVGAVVLLGACGESLEGKLGEELYDAGCARCHGGEGTGGIGPAIGTADSNTALALTDEMIRGVIRVGPGRMPAFGELTDEQVDSLVVYLRELQAADALGRE